MKWLNIVSVKCLSILLIGFVTAEIIEIDDGQIEGTILTSRLGRQFHGFIGIPYAQAPIDSLRFQAPVPVNSWTGVLNATSYGPWCYQAPRGHTISINMSEDCLHINVFSPNLSGSLPVIVHIFGGGFVYGSVEQGRPENLMDLNVVVVNFNYRIAALGFLAVGTTDVPGNAGMKDQILALQWIQRNIARFGGNPNSVTLAGLSAGGVSATSHMLSPMAQGLFHRVISMSGAIGNIVTGTTSTGLVRAKNLALTLNCTETSDINVMLTCLRQVFSIRFYFVKIFRYLTFCSVQLLTLSHQ